MARCERSVGQSKAPHHITRSKTCQDSAVGGPVRTRVSKGTGHITSKMIYDDSSIVESKQSFLRACILGVCCPAHGNVSD